MFINIISSARIWKNLPLLFLFLSGFMINYSHHITETIIILCLIAISFASAFMTHINIITDKELDAKSKPHLYQKLTANRKVMIGGITLELLVVIIICYYLLLTDFQTTALFIIAFTLAATLYSFNFLSVSPIKNRLKVHWIGHFISVISGYLSLWLSGFYLSDNNEYVLFWLPVFFASSLSEYALFLFESSIDTNEEKEFKLKTIAAKYGEKTSTNIAILLAGLSAFTLILLAVFRTEPIIKYSFLPIALFIFGFLLYVSYKRLFLKQSYYKIPDLIFNFGRIYVLLSIIYLKFIV